MEAATSPINASQLRRLARLARIPYDFARDKLFAAQRRLAWTGETPVATQANRAILWEQIKG
jgi:hypothetical protein